MMEKTTRSVERAARLYRLLLNAYPAAFRRAYDAEMLLLFRELAQAAWRRRGRVGLWFCVFRLLVDLLCSASREHWREWHSIGKGAVAMKLKKLLTWHITSDAADRRWTRRWGPGLISAFALVFAFLALHKCIALHLTAVQWFLGALVAVSLAMQMFVYALLLSLLKSTALRGSVAWQIVIYTISGLVFIGGIMGLGYVAQAEFEVFLGVLLAIGVMLAGMSLGVIWPLAQAARTRRRRKLSTGKVAP